MREREVPPPYRKLVGASDAGLGVHRFERRRPARRARAARLRHVTDGRRAQEAVVVPLERWIEIRESFGTMQLLIFPVFLFICLFRLGLFFLLVFPAKRKTWEGNRMDLEPGGRRERRK